MLYDFVTMSDINGKVTLITGASSGLGAATAILLARLGAKLSLTGRNEDLKHTVDECVRVSPAQAEQPLMVLADLCSEADVTKLVDTTIEKFGRLDILVNNAGVAELGTIESSTMEMYDRIMNVNVRSVYHLTMLCVPHLIQTHGNIVNVSSLCGTRIIFGRSIYCMSKSAVNMMTNAVALELPPKGVLVNSVNPGVVPTNIQRRAGLTGDAYDKHVKHMKEIHPLGRVGDPEEVAQAIAFLASSNASFITGEQLHIDGGLHAVCAR